MHVPQGAKTTEARKVDPGKMLAYNCSPSFNWKRNLDDVTITDSSRSGIFGNGSSQLTMTASTIARSAENGIRSNRSLRNALTCCRAMNRARPFHSRRMMLRSKTGHRHYRPISIQFVKS